MRRPDALAAVQEVENTWFGSPAATEKAIAETRKLVAPGVQAHEGNLVRYGLEHIERRDAATERINSVADRLEQVTRRLRRGTDDDVLSLIPEWARAEQEANYLLKFAENFYPDRVTSLLEQLSDPLASLAALQQKYPAMNRPFYGI